MTGALVYFLRVISVYFVLWIGNFRLCLGVCIAPVPHVNMEFRTT